MEKRRRGRGWVSRRLRLEQMRSTRAGQARFDLAVMVAFDTIGFDPFNGQKGDPTKLKER